MPFPWAVPGGSELARAVRPPGHGGTTPEAERPQTASGHGRGGTPGPIPNPEVKPPSADCTAGQARGRPGRRWPTGGVFARRGPAPSAGPLFCAQAQSPRCKAPGFSMFGYDNLQVTCSLLSQFVCRLSCSCFIHGVAMICFGHRYFWAVTFGAHLPPYCPMKGQVLSHASQSTSLFC